MATRAACECGSEEQTVDHVLTSCPFYQFSEEGRGLEVVDDSTVAWLRNKCLAFSSVVQNLLH